MWPFVHYQMCVICNLSFSVAIPDNEDSDKSKKIFPKYKVYVKLHYHITCKNSVTGLQKYNLKLKAFNKIHLLLLLQFVFICVFFSCHQVVLHSHPHRQFPEHNLSLHIVHLLLYNFLTLQPQN